MLKAIAFIAVFCSLSTLVHAQDKCESVALLAQSIMEARQSGVPVRDLMNAFSGNESEGFKKAAKQLVISAYEVPEYSTESMQEKAVRNFENDIYLECAKS